MTKNRPTPSEPPRAASQRSVPLVARADLHAKQTTYQGETYWTVKDPVNLAYFRLREEHYAILQLLDGERSLESIRNEFLRQFPTVRLSLTQVRQLITDLHRQGLAWSKRSGQEDVLLRRAAKRRRNAWLGAVRNLLYIRLPGWDPHTLLRRAYPAARWMFSRWVVLSVALAFAATWAVLLVRFDEFQRRVPQLADFASWQSLLCLWATLGVAKVLHELGHGFACRHFGGECHEIGIAFLVFSPCLYCDVSDSWMLGNRWKRIAVAAAGMYVESILSVLAILLWWNTRAGPLHDVCFMVFLVTNVTTLVFNLNPFLRLDGYYILSDCLEIPNLRQKADQLLQRSFAFHCLGVRLPNDPFLPTRGKVWFVLFAIASAAYRWLLVLAICLLLYRLLKPYGLEYLGLMLGITSAISALTTRVWHVGRLIRAHRDEIVASRRPAVALAIVASCVMGALFIPVPWHIDAPLVVEPQDLRHVYVTSPGRLDVVMVRLGQRVKRGDVLVKLGNGRQQQRLRELETALAVQQIELRIQQAGGDPAQEAIATETLQAIHEEVVDYDRQVARLSVLAPCDGVVVAPPARPQGPMASLSARLPSWHGTPLDPRNLGCFLESGTRLLSIAPTDRFEAVLLIEQSHRHDYRAGQEVRIKIDPLPGKTFRGEIVSVSPRARDFTATVVTPAADKQDHAAMSDSTLRPYQATALLPEGIGLLIPGMRGRARVLVTKRTAAGWLWRYARSTFSFAM